MYPFYDFSTRTVYVPVATRMHMCGYDVPTYLPGRVLDTDLSAGEAASLYGGITETNL